MRIRVNSNNENILELMHRILESYAELLTSWVNRKHIIPSVIGATIGTVIAVSVASAILSAGLSARGEMHNQERYPRSFSLKLDRFKHTESRNKRILVASRTDSKNKPLKSLGWRIISI